MYRFLFCIRVIFCRTFRRVALLRAARGLQQQERHESPFIANREGGLLT